MQRGIFLDRDGTIIRHIPYLRDPRDVQLLSGTPDGLRTLAKAGYCLFVVSNQSGVARRYFSMMELREVNDRMYALLSRQDIYIVDARYCIHAPEENCTCRKPSPGSIIELAEMHCIALDQSWMVGDSESDVEAGRRAGCRTGLIEAGTHTGGLCKRMHLSQPDFVVPDLRAAAERILSFA